MGGCSYDVYGHNEMGQHSLVADTTLLTNDRYDDTDAIAAKNTGEGRIIQTYTSVPEIIIFVSTTMNKIWL